MPDPLRMVFIGRRRDGDNRLLVQVVLFDGFEPLDVFGPVEVLGYLGKMDDSPETTEIRFASLGGGLVRGSYGVAIDTTAVRESENADVIVVPGGSGTRPLVSDVRFVNALSHLADHAAHCLTVCTGSALLAATGLLDGRRATSNKRAFEWVRSVRPQVDWVNHARWVSDGKFITSSGVSAGIDMGSALSPNSMATYWLNASPPISNTAGTIIRTKILLLGSPNHDEHV